MIHREAAALQIRPSLADEAGMLLPHTPMSNVERQRRFREANPGYYARIKRQHRAMMKRAGEQYLEQLRQATLAQQALAEATTESETAANATEALAMAVVPMIDLEPPTAC